MSSAMDRLFGNVFGVSWPLTYGIKGQLLMDVAGVELPEAVRGFLYKAEGSDVGPIRVRGRVTLNLQDVRAAEATVGVLSPHQEASLTQDFVDQMLQEVGYHFTTIEHFIKPCEGVAWRHEDQLYAEKYSEEVEELDKTAAGQRAFDLLWEHLSPEQRRSWIRDRSFVVTLTGEPPAIWKMWASKANRRTKHRHHKHRLWQNLEARKYLFDGNTTCGSVNAYTYDGQFLFNVCSHPPTPFPTGDALLAMKLQLEENEKKFLRMSNLSDYDGLEQFNLEWKGLHLCRVA